ncbi:hypothetical protein F6W79_19350 [Vibrio diabolicus]|uniref:hypothetical protein n=1 Tax=Vibrio diabolicus TaxID=50719 RepID=UPI00124413B3|nr:hypothetical protein [Vibrio diabolicus]KAB0317169.1 hypothetical protein F6W79_19350 [Vibrio diabolicus]
MRNWYVYHSRKTVKRTYSSLAESTVFSKSNHRELCIGDLIWVIEGDLDNPVNFTLVDCFRYTSNEYPPFVRGFEDFKYKFSGDSLFTKPAIELEKSMPWFKELHQRYITKQKFFNNISDEEYVVNGLFDVSGLVV